MEEVNELYENLQSQAMEVMKEDKMKWLPEKRGVFQLNHVIIQRT